LRYLFCGEKFAVCLKRVFITIPFSFLWQKTML
jgi:hypothetical protein